MPSELKIITTENKQYLLSPLPATYMVNAASTLQAALNDILRSPPPCSATFPRPLSVHKPLPLRPRSTSLPSTPDLPAELPGSILQENQGFPPEATPGDLVTVRPISQNIWRSTHPLVESPEDEEDFSALLNLFPEPLLHARSVPSLSDRHSEMRSVRSGNALNSAAASKPGPLRVKYQKSSSETNSRRHSRSDLAASPFSMDAKSSAGGNGDNFIRPRVRTSKTLQPSPFILEGQAWSENCRSEVSTICFQDLVCLFVKQDALHNETVSELFFFPPFPLR